MSRRDTIIIAVLVNAALLMVLFVTAVRSDRKDEKIVQKEMETELALKDSQKPQENQSDDLLNQFIAGAPTLELPTLHEESVVFEEEMVLPAAQQEKLPVVGEKERVVAAKAPEEEKKFANVTVKKGDFLEKIAKANHTTVNAIMKANNLSSTQLKVGQVLRVPLTGNKSSSGSKSGDTHSQDAEYYIVKDGDNPWLIASKNHLKLDELLRLNQLDDQKAKKLRPGDRLRIR